MLFGEIMLFNAVYWFCKLYFMFLWLWYILAVFGYYGLDTFAHVTGIISLVFLGSNLKWYLSPPT